MWILKRKSDGVEFPYQKPRPEQKRIELHLVDFDLIEVPDKKKGAVAAPVAAPVRAKETESITIK